MQFSLQLFEGIYFEMVEKSRYNHGRLYTAANGKYLTNFFSFWVENHGLTVDSGIAKGPKV
jgi:hypothetical protein